MSVNHGAAPSPPGPTPVHRPSMSDVAARAGVSAQTVSRVANGSPSVTEDTRRRVEAAMVEMGYRPNRAARALKSGRFRTVGLLVEDLRTYGSAQTLAAVVEAAAHHELGTDLEVLRSAGSSEVAGGLRRLDEGSVDGLVVVAEHEDVVVAAQRAARGLPLVVVGSWSPPEVTCVRADQEAGVRAAVEHLLGLGHETVHAVTGPGGSSTADLREQQWRRSLRAAGRPVPDPVVAAWTSRSGWEAGNVLAPRPEVTAVLAVNDQVALGLLRAFHEHGREVPGSVSVVGFDDVPEASLTSPPLTTVRQDFRAAGGVAVDLLLRSLEGPGGGAGLHLVPTQLVVRSSTGPRTVA